MPIAMVFIVAFFLFIVLFWVCGLLYANDFSVPTTKDFTTIKRVLVIFPHADDEALTAGGFISSLTRNRKDVQWVILTKGEKGNPKGELDESLKLVRAKEAQKAAEIYGIKHVIQKDYPDGDVEKYKKKLEKDVQEIIDKIRPDLVITYDLAGLYGHPDHIVVSDIVTELLKRNINMKLWYASYPKRILDSVSLPEHMAKDDTFRKRRSYPTHNVWVGVRGIINKVNAVYAYKSQREAYVSSFPFRFIPLWFYISLTPFEYFHEAL